jgi:hypothetical protein
MRTAARVDRNQKEIVDYCRGKGFSVLVISQLKNCCDLFISKNGYTIAIEIKDNMQPPSKRRLTEGERKFKDSWKGAYRIVYTTGDIDVLDMAINNLI